MPLTVYQRSVVGDRGHGRIESRDEQDGTEFEIDHSSINVENELKEGKPGSGELLTSLFVQ